MPDVLRVQCHDGRPQHETRVGPARERGSVAGDAVAAPAGPSPAGGGVVAGGRGPSGSTTAGRRRAAGCPRDRGPGRSVGGDCRNRGSRPRGPGRGGGARTGNPCVPDRPRSWRPAPGVSGPAARRPSDSARGGEDGSRVERREELDRAGRSRSRPALPREGSRARRRRTLTVRRAGRILTLPSRRHRDKKSLENAPASPCGTAPRGAFEEGMDDRGPRAFQGVRQPRRRVEGVLPGRTGGDPRIPGAERGRQDHHDEDDHGLRTAVGRIRAGRRQGRLDGPVGRQVPHRIPVRGSARLP